MDKLWKQKWKKHSQKATLYGSLYVNYPEYTNTYKLDRFLCQKLMGREKEELLLRVWTFFLGDENVLKIDSDPSIIL